MKKIYQSPKYKRYSVKRAQRQFLNKRKRNKIKRGHNLFLAHIHHRSAEVKWGKYTILVPVIFGIVQNTTATLAVFHELQEQVRLRHTVFLDMSKCDRIDPDALLYILTLFDTYKIKRTQYRIQGNYPSDKKALDLLISSGFFNYVHSALPNTPLNTHVLKIVSGNHVSTSIAKSVIDFSLQHMKVEISAKSRAIYRIIIEMMNNTKHHAFKTKTDTSKWHLMAVHYEESNVIQFTFLDGGLGVPTTIIRRNYEKVQQLFSSIIGVAGVNAIDARLMKSALEGEFMRTQTGMPNRGKGMPEIYALSKKGFIGNLKLISRFGYVDCGPGSTTALATEFKGTLYNWEFL